ncbi:MAG: hypothetical protein K0Q50_2778 [Vampirovibrio sp.]|jgi:tetratricopeptide (TPR) repeat protein|nr:hypothetical protein [Vampirovibrio sp.]
MQQPVNQGITTGEASVDTHHEVLSVTQPQAQGLLNHLQTGLPNPLDLILDEVSTSSSLLQNVSVTPVVAQPVARPTVMPEAPPGKVVVDHGRPLSQCLLWDIMHNYYSNLGINAWQAGIPMFITNSVYFSESYAEMILAFVEDYYDRLDLNEPLYIVEMATGTGRFTHHLLRELERKISCFSKLQKVRFKYIMTDFTDKNPTFWQGHDKLKPFVEKGLLDFAVLNPLQENVLNLRVSGETISSEVIKNPLLAIGNYFFDSMPVDVFRVESKVLKEGRVTLLRNIEGVDPNSEIHITQVETKFEYHELYNTNYYNEPSFNELLNHYRHNIKNGTVLFPLGTLQVIKNLQALANNRLVLFSSDKAYTCPYEMIRYYQHDFAIHDGTFSYMVNYDAMGTFFKKGGGQFFHTTGKNVSLQTVCCIQMDEPDCQFERLNYLFQEKLDRSTPINSVCATMPYKDQENPVAKLNVMLGHMRLNLADPHIFSCYGQALVDVCNKGLKGQQDDLLMLMERALEQYYYYPGESNMPFWFSQVYHTLGFYEKSLACLDLSLQFFGEHEVLHFLKGQNYQKLQQWNEARTEYMKAVEMRSNFQEAWDCITEIDNRIK